MSSLLLTLNSKNLQQHKLRSRIAVRMTLCIVFTCSAGGPGFDSHLRRIILGCSMQRMQVALVKPLHSGDPNVMRNSHAVTCIRSDLHAYATRNRITFSHDPSLRLGGGELQQHKLRSRIATNTLFEWLFAQNVRLQCRRSRVRFLPEKQHSQMLYAEDVDGPGQAPTN